MEGLLYPTSPVLAVTSDALAITVGMFGLDMLQTDQMPEHTHARELAEYPNSSQ
jgi:hypothetical protein